MTKHRNPLVPSIRTFLAVLLIGAGIACHADLLAPSPQTLVGRWRRAPEPQSPMGQYFRTIEFTIDGHYVLTGAFRGVYSQLPVDSVGSITRQYGTYVLDGDILRFAEDSVRSWDYLSGTYVHAGPPQGIPIEGASTDPKVELTHTRLTLRYSVNPGGGYVAVTDDYDRDR